ncbi:MAG: nucleotidyltransferase domain-containing protein [Coriobacteriia bacterium]|nr:nucleotidyltransferase domain-containing protein [Coriobacteriia bacterium]
MFSVTEHNDRSPELQFRVGDRPTAQEAAFGLLLDAAPDAFTEAEVRSALGIPKTTAHIALSGLVREGLAHVERVGRTGRFSVDPADPLMRTLKTARAIRKAQWAIEPVRDRIELAVLFGSASRGEDRRDSDVDLLVVTEEYESVLTALAEHPWLQPVIMTAAKHMTLIAENGTFARETARGITVWERR